ncbi:MAG TPA: molybdate ABC transporter substrate-binding protein [bacterium]|nr:molybdate ABC transporter substrate-binding protein [bacterium]
MKRTKFLAVIALAMLACTFPVAAQKQEVVLSAAASLTDVLTALKPEAEHYTGASLILNFGASGTLRAQIEQGAPADVFFSAATSHMNTLEKSGLIVAATRRDMLSNAMVLVGDGTRKNPVSREELAAVLSQARILAIGNPDSVPAGAYAVEALKSLGLYGLVEKKLVLGGNVRQVLQYVESGSAPLGIVFLTDAASVSRTSPLVRLYQFPDSLLANPVVYPIAVVTASKHADAAARLIEFLGTDTARKAFAEAGFAIP